MQPRRSPRIRQLNFPRIVITGTIDLVDTTDSESEQENPMNDTQSQGKKINIFLYTVYIISLLLVLIFYATEHADTEHLLDNSSIRSNSDKMNKTDGRTFEEISKMFKRKAKRPQLSPSKEVIISTFS